MGFFNQLFSSWQRFEGKKPVAARAIKVFVLPLLGLGSLILWPCGTLLAVLFTALIALGILLVNVVFGPVACYVLNGQMGEFGEDYVHTAVLYFFKKRR